MALEIRRQPADRQRIGILIADRRLCLTRDRSRVVEAGDPASACLFATPGTQITAEDVARYGLVAEAGVVVLPAGYVDALPESASDIKPSVPANKSQRRTPKRAKK